MGAYLLFGVPRGRVARDTPTVGRVNQAVPSFGREMYALDKSPVLCRWAIFNLKKTEPHERVPNSHFLCRQLTLEIQRVLEMGRLVVWKPT